MTEKPRMVEVTAKADVTYPHIVMHSDGRYWADADELREWRATRLASISEGKPE